MANTKWQIQKMKIQFKYTDFHFYTRNSTPLRYDLFNESILVARELCNAICLAYPSKKMEPVWGTPWSFIKLEKKLNFWIPLITQK